MKLQKIRDERGLTRMFEIRWKKEIVSGMIVLDTHQRPAYAFPISVLCGHELLNPTSFALCFRSHRVVVEAEDAAIVLQSVLKREARLFVAGRSVAGVEAARNIINVTVEPKISFGLPTAGTKSSIRFIKRNGVSMSFRKHELLWIKLTFDSRIELGFSTKIIILQGWDLNGVFAELVTHDNYTIYEVPERHDFGGGLVTSITEQNHKHGS